jgi:hypothetical protein
MVSVQNNPPRKKEFFHISHMAQRARHKGLQGREHRLPKET